MVTENILAETKGVPEIIGVKYLSAGCLSTMAPPFLIQSNVTGM